MLSHYRLGILLYLAAAWAVAVVLILVAYAVASWFTRKRTAASLWDAPPLATPPAPPISAPRRHSEGDNHE